MEEINMTKMFTHFSECSEFETDVKGNLQNLEQIVVKQELEPEIFDTDIKTEYVCNKIEDVFDSKHNVGIKQDGFDLQEFIEESHIKIEETENCDTINNTDDKADNSNNQTISCNKCNYTTTKKKLMQKHVKVHNVGYDLTKMLKCEHCSFVTHIGANLREHALTHKNEKIFGCDFCNYKTHNKRYLKYHMSRHEAKTLECNFCSYTTSQVRLLNLHKKMHITEKIFKCAQCDYKTNTKMSFKVHMQVHTVDTQSLCDECGSEFKGPINLKKHKRDYHSEATSFLCDVCGYRVAKLQVFNEHMRSHTGSNYRKPLQCEHCPYFAFKMGQLKKHIELHMNGKFYHCDQCNYKTKNISDLVLHMKTHLNT